jgi:hypothetical protein
MRSADSWTVLIPISKMENIVMRNNEKEKGKEGGKI